MRMAFERQLYTPGTHGARQQGHYKHNWRQERISLAFVIKKTLFDIARTIEPREKTLKTV